MNIETVFYMWFATGVTMAILNHGWHTAFFWNEFPTLQCKERFTELNIRQIGGFVLVTICPLVIVVTFLMGMTKHGLMFKYPKP